MQPDKTSGSVVDGDGREIPSFSGQTASVWDLLSWPWKYLTSSNEALNAKAAEDYDRELQACESEDFTDLEALQLIQTGFEDVEGRPVVLLLARQLPAALIRPSTLYRFVISRLDEVTKRAYSIVYVHTGATYWKNSPGIRWLWATYGRVPERYRKNLHRVYVIHSDLTLWATMWMIGPLLRDSLWSKVMFLLRVEFLWEYVKDSMTLPEYVLEHDKELEEHPLMDYGIVSTRDAPWQASMG